jgi:predicted nucleotidyltransferase
MIATNEQEKIIGIIKLFVPQATIYIFGSHARGDTTATSDLDIALDQGSQIPHQLLGELRSVLDGLWISYKIDLVDFHRMPEALQQNIMKKHITWKN